MAKKAVARTSIALVTFRMATIFGERDPGNMMRLVRAIDTRPLVHIGQGRNRKSLVASEDAARACVVAALHGREKPGTYNVTAPPIEMRRVVDIIARELGKPVPKLVVPRVLANAISLLVPGIRGVRLRKLVRSWTSDDAYDGSSFEHSFGFQPSVSHEDGIPRVVKWYKSAT